MGTDWKEHWGATRGEYVSPRTTLLLYNTYDIGTNETNRAGKRLAEYYAELNNVDEEMLCGIDCGTGSWTLQLWMDGLENLASQIKAKVLEYLFANNLVGKVRSILTFKGFPLRWEIGDQDNRFYGAMDWELRTLCEDGSDYKMKRENRYWNYCQSQGSGASGSVRPRRFTATWQYNNECMFLVSRIDGYSEDHCRQLIESAHAKIPSGGKAFIDQHWHEGIREKSNWYNYVLDSLGTTLEELGLTVTPDASNDRQKFGEASFYAGWYTLPYRYSTVGDRYFVPGAVAAEIQSASAQCFLHDPLPSPTIPDPQAGELGWPCFAALYIARGVAATLGAVAEPELNNYTRLDIFGWMLQKGYTVAEAFFASTPKPSMYSRYPYGNMVLLGDPAYRPFPAKCLL